MPTITWSPPIAPTRVTLSIASGPSNGTLIGTTTVQAVNGIATFNGVTLPKTGSYKLQIRDSCRRR